MSREEPEGREPEAAVGNDPFSAELGGDERPGEDSDSHIDNSRQEDYAVLNSFWESFQLRVLDLQQELEERFFHILRFQNLLFQQWMQSLTEVMQHVEELRVEMWHLCSIMEAASQDFHWDPEASGHPQT